MEIINLYNKLIFNYEKLNQNQINLLLYNLNILSLALYIKNLTKDSRDLYQLSKIIKEELYV
jgi:hypothetical protein